MCSYANVTTTTAIISLIINPGDQISILICGSANYRV